MKTLDRYIVRTFLMSVMLWFVVLMSLRVVTDLFVNMDEFVKIESRDKNKDQRRFVDVLQSIGTYYGRQSLVYLVELGGIVIVSGAAFSIARMNHTNELTAMLASGVSMHRVVAPIILCAMIMGAVLVVDQEIIIPSLADKLILPRDDPMGKKDVQIRLLSDLAGNSWYSPHFSPADKEMEQPVVLLRDKEGALQARVTGSKARPAVVNGQEGWLIWDASLVRNAPWHFQPDNQTIFTTVSPQKLFDRAYERALEQAKAQREKEVRETGRAVTELPDPNCDLVRDVELLDTGYALRVEANVLELDSVIKPGRPRDGVLRHASFAYLGDDGKSVLARFIGDVATYRPGIEASHWDLSNGILFLPTDLEAEAIKLRQHSRYLDYLSSWQISDYLKLERISNRAAAELIRSIRYADPVNNIIMLLLGLPFVLSRERNIKASAGLCLLMVGAYYVFIYICRYMALPAAWAAWLPVLLFGPVAAVMFDSVKT